MASRRRDYGSLSPRLQELSAKTTPIEPYPVTDTISIEAPGKKRRGELNDAYATIQACAARLNAMFRRSDPRPVPPTAPTAPALPVAAEDATEEQRAEVAALTEQLTTDYEAKVAEHDELMATFTEELTAWEDRADNLDTLADQLTVDSKAAAEQYNRALFGAAYDDVMALSEDWDPLFWDEFLNDVNAHFSSGANPPEDGTCRTCGQVIDEEAAGKAPSSST